MMKDPKDPTIYDAFKELQELFPECNVRVECTIYPGWKTPCWGGKITKIEKAKCKKCGIDTEVEISSACVQYSFKALKKELYTGVNK